jgi:hypothetical protein
MSVIIKQINNISEEDLIIQKFNAKGELHLSSGIRPESQFKSRVSTETKVGVFAMKSIQSFWILTYENVFYINDEMCPMEANEIVITYDKFGFHYKFI